ncbi:hypothetical protein IWX47DRAFT_866966 [Phyllosticta citricarpa]
MEAFPFLSLSLSLSLSQNLNLFLLSHSTNPTIQSTSTVLPNSTSDRPRPPCPYWLLRSAVIVTASHLPPI